jgi:hypothetical protein
MGCAGIRKRRWGSATTAATAATREQNGRPKEHYEFREIHGILSVVV